MVLLYVHAAAAQEATVEQFGIGMEAMKASRILAGADRERKLDEAIEIFQAILTQRPELARVRLELARAHFLKREDRKARRHFRQVLAAAADEIPPTVVRDILRFLYVIRERRVWDVRLDVATVYDSNINGASTASTVWLNTPFGRLPFERASDTKPVAGFGTVLSATAQYEHHLATDWRLRAGSAVAVQEYPGSEFDRQLGNVWLGPRWLAGESTSLDLLVTASREWTDGQPQADRYGFRLEAEHRLTPRIDMQLSAYHRLRNCRDCDWFDATEQEVSAELFWAPSTVLRLSAGGGWGWDRSRNIHWRTSGPKLRVGASVDMPLGLTIGADGALAWEDYDGAGDIHHTLDSRPRKDRTATLSISILKRSLVLLGFSPRLSVHWDERETNAQTFGYHRHRVEVQFARSF